MTLDAGKYLLRNNSSSEYATLPKNVHNANVKGAMKNGKTDQKWFVELLDNGNYTLVNAAFDSTTYAGAKAAKGQFVVGQETLSQWKVTELDPGTYRISVSNLAWSLEDQDVTLASFDKNDDRQIWKFQPTN